MKSSTMPEIRELCNLFEKSGKKRVFSFSFDFILFASVTSLNIHFMLSYMNDVTYFNDCITIIPRSAQTFTYIF